MFTFGSAARESNLFYATPPNGKIIKSAAELPGKSGHAKPDPHDPDDETGKYDAATSPLIKSIQSRNG